MGKVTIKIDELGAGSAVLDNAPITEIEHVRVERVEGEQPLAEVGLETIDRSTVRINVVTDPLDPQDTVTVTFDGAPDARVREEADEDEPQAKPETESAPEGEDGSEEEGEDSEVLLDLTRPQLNDRAREAGVEDPGALPNKPAVIEAIEAASKED